MSDYPIEGLMKTAMNSIREMIDVNTIIGDPIETTNNVVVIPVSKVNFGFATGGSEFNGKSDNKNTNININKNEINKTNYRMPFGGGSGAGVSINPIAFIVVQQSGVKLIPVEHNSSMLDLIPDFFEKINQIIEQKTKKIEKIKNMNFEYGNNSDIDWNSINKSSNKRNNSNNINDNDDNEDNDDNKSSIYKNNQENKNEYDYEFDETSDI